MSMQRLLSLRAENPALRPSRFARDDQDIPSASVMDWYDERGEMMSGERWADPTHRTLQYLATSTPELEAPNRTLLIVHGNERPVTVRLPLVDGVAQYRSVWSSEDEHPSATTSLHEPGSTIELGPTSMRLFVAVPT